MAGGNLAAIASAFSENPELDRGASPMRSESEMSSQEKSDRIPSDSESSPTKGKGRGRGKGRRTNVAEPKRCV